jgi:methylmalonyl-CoA mutase
MLQKLQSAVIENKHVFEVLMEAVRVCSLGQITNALFEVGGQYRRNMNVGYRPEADISIKL